MGAGSADAAALHADYTRVSQASPAKPSEVVALYLTGMGAVSPSLAPGAPWRGRHRVPSAEPCDDIRHC
jgi:uncharacterized protein (TIGR03437 family)